MEVVKDRKDCGSCSSNNIDKMNVSLCGWRLYDNLQLLLKGMLLNCFVVFVCLFFAVLCVCLCCCGFVFLIVWVFFWFCFDFGFFRFFFPMS